MCTAPDSNTASTRHSGGHAWHSVTRHSTVPRPSCVHARCNWPSGLPYSFTPLKPFHALGELPEERTQPVAVLVDDRRRAGLREGECRLVRPHRFRVAARLPQSVRALPSWPSSTISSTTTACPNAANRAADLGALVRRTGPTAPTPHRARFTLTSQVESPRGESKRNLSVRAIGSSAGENH